MKIQESAENYLETILILSQRQPYVRSIDIATELELDVYKRQVNDSRVHRSHGRRSFRSDRVHGHGGCRRCV